MASPRTRCAGPYRNTCGIASTAALDASNSGQCNTCKTTSPGSVTTTSTNELLYAVGSSADAMTWTTGSGFALRQSVAGKLVTEDQVAAAPGAEASSFTTSANGNLASIVIAFKSVIPDTTAPSVPTNLVATSTSQTQINLSWSASTDNVGVTGYKISRGGVQIATRACLRIIQTPALPQPRHTPITSPRLMLPAMCRRQ